MDEQSKAAGFYQEVLDHMVWHRAMVMPVVRSEIMLKRI